MFLGDVSQTNVPLIKDGLQSETSQTPPMGIRLGGLGAFPSMNRPRVIWIGVEATPDLFSLQRRIASNMERLGYKREERPFSPHLTLGRVSRYGSTMEIRKLGEDLNEVKIGFLGLATVHHIHLYRSDLSPGGPQYKKVVSINLSSTEQFLER
jgi:2'-5' RNA ligase